MAEPNHALVKTEAGKHTRGTSKSTLAIASIVSGRVDHARPPGAVGGGSLRGPKVGTWVLNNCRIASHEPLPGYLKDEDIGRPVKRCPSPTAAKEPGSGGPRRGGRVSVSVDRLVGSLPASSGHAYPLADRSRSDVGEVEGKARYANGDRVSEGDRARGGLWGTPSSNEDGPFGRPR